MAASNSNPGGGLATGLGSIYKSGDNIWIGWPGNTVEDPEQRAEIILELHELKMAPVFLFQRRCGAVL